MEGNQNNISYELNTDQDVSLANSIEKNINDGVKPSSVASFNVSVDETQKAVHEKREKNKKVRIISFSIIVVLILLIGLFFLLRFFSKLKKYEYNEDYPMYQYFSGVKVSYDGKLTLTNNGDITTIKTKEGISDIKDAPIYFQNVANETLTTKNMQLVIPRLFNKNYKLKYFTRLVYDKDAKVSYYLKGRKQVYLDDAFLYDGDNLYLFLTNVSLVVNKEEYNLSPLSYIIVNYKGQVEMYDKINDKYTVIDLCESDVTGNLGQYNINFSTDMLSYDNNSRLLIKSVDNLNEYSMNE